MKFKAVLFALFFAFPLGSAGADVSATKPVPLKLRGMCISMHARADDFAYETLVDQVAALGCSDVLLLVAGYQQNIRSQEISFNHMGVPSRESVVSLIRYIHLRGMRVLLLPLVLLEDVNTDQDWRGGIKPPDWEVWFEQYRKFITYYAKIAAETKVEIFGVGSELISTEVFRERWLKVIEGARAVYDGKLLYSANWDHYEEVTFWDKLDYVGVTSYNTLTNSNEPGFEQLRDAWLRILGDIARWQAKVGKKIIMTEVGYPSQDGCNKNPWNYYATEKVDMEEQALCFKAFFDACGKICPFYGVYVFEWWGEGGSKDFNYTPRGKPAEKVISEWFQGGKVGPAPKSISQK